MVIQGTKGQGKSYFLFWLFCLLCWLKIPIFLVDRKGDLYRMCRDWAIANGHASQLKLMDFGDKEHLPKYNRFMKGVDPAKEARAGRGAVFGGDAELQILADSQNVPNALPCPLRGH